VCLFFGSESLLDDGSSLDLATMQVVLFFRLAVD
jgi:hypothetical protein